MSDDDRTSQGSPDRFGYEWSTYSSILPESRGQLERWLGSTTLESFRGKRVMDVGCGMGRNPYWYVQAGAKEVLGVDVDEGSLAAARKNLAPFANARVERHSAHELDPAVVGTFDRVTCIGVLHHLADPENALQKMWSCVAPGGDLVLWCYSTEGNRMLLPVIQTFRALGSRLPIGATHAVAKVVTALAWPAIHTIPWRTDYYRYLRKLSFKNVESIIFDQMLPQIAHYWSRDRVQSLMREAGLRDVRLAWVNEMSWSAIGTKPIAAMPAAKG